MTIQKILDDGRVPVKIWTDEIDLKAQQQLSNIASLPFIHHHVAAMPDVQVQLSVASLLATKPLSPQPLVLILVAA
jgi:tRNA-splicing ligase RtcB